MHRFIPILLLFGLTATAQGENDPAATVEARRERASV